MKECKVPEYQAELCAAFAQGRPGRAVKLAKSADFEEIKSDIINLLKNIYNMDLSALVSVIKQINEYEISIDDVLDIMTLWFRDVLMFKATREVDNLVFKQEINYIKEQIPHAIIRTTLIVGFPGEDENDFNILKDYVSKMHFDRLGVFQYSDEENTVAYDFDNKISDDVKLQRFEEIMEIQYQVIEDNNKLLLGKTFEALVDHFDNRKQMFALRSYREAPDEVDGYIYVKDSLEIGKYYNIEITDYKGYDLFGKIKSTN
jgi:hypothetical protein